MSQIAYALPTSGSNAYAEALLVLGQMFQSSGGRFPVACGEEMELQSKSMVWEQIVFHTQSACSGVVDYPVDWLFHSIVNDRIGVQPPRRAH